MPTTTSADGTRIAYETLGSGPAIVLVDGAMCFRDSGPMRPIAQALAGRFTVVLYDRRGRGESGDTAPFAIAREIEDIDALIREVGGSAALFGISSGGALSLEASAALGPERVTHLAVYEIPFMPDGMRASAAEYTATLTATLADGRDADAIELFMRRVGVPDAGIAGMKASPAWPATVALAPTLAYDDAAMGDSSVPLEIVSMLAIPVLTLAGGASPDFLQYGVRTLADEAGGRFELVDGQTHDISAEAVAPYLASFLAPAAR